MNLWLFRLFVGNTIHLHPAQLLSHTPNPRSSADNKVRYKALRTDLSYPVLILHYKPHISVRALAGWELSSQIYAGPKIPGQVTRLCGRFYLVPILK